MFDAATHNLSLRTPCRLWCRQTVARLVMLVSIHSLSHIQPCAHIHTFTHTHFRVHMDIHTVARNNTVVRTPNELFYRIAASDCIINDFMSVCAPKEEGSTDESRRCSILKLRQRREKCCRARCWFGVRGFRLLSIRIDEKRLWSLIFLYLCTIEISSVSVWFVYKFYDAPDRHRGSRVHTTCCKEF